MGSKARYGNKGNYLTPYTPQYSLGYVGLVGTGGPPLLLRF